MLNELFPYYQSIGAFLSEQGPIVIPLMAISFCLGLILETWRSTVAYLRDMKDWRKDIHELRQRIEAMTQPMAVFNPDQVDREQIQAAIEESPPPQIIPMVEPSKPTETHSDVVNMMISEMTDKYYDSLACRSDEYIRSVYKLASNMGVSAVVVDEGNYVVTNQSIGHVTKATASAMAVKPLGILVDGVVQKPKKPNNQISVPMDLEEQLDRRVENYSKGLTLYALKHRDLFLKDSICAADWPFQEDNPFPVWPGAKVAKDGQIHFFRELETVPENRLE